LEFSASVDFIHEESATMQGHTIIKEYYPISSKGLGFVRIYW